MFLKGLKFSRYKGEKNEWSIEGKPTKKQNNDQLTLSDINLIVGKNASGKSKTIAAIRQIADLISGEVKLSHLRHNTSEYFLEFDDNGKNIIYELSFKDGEIQQEKLIIDRDEKLNRFEKKLFYEGAKEFLSFTTDNDTIALTRRDSSQQPFFENLYQWGKNLSHYSFGTQLGKNAFVRDIKAVKLDDEISLKDSDEVTEIFIRGQRKFNSDFVKTIVSDMENIGYNIGDIDAVSMEIIPAFGLAVSELDIEKSTNQLEMSQGMFRALSLLIQLNYSLFTKIPSCILIDDIGEGLDYDRSKSLIDLVINKIKGSDIQLIMTTNDRFVMNKIPLLYWSIIQRVPGKAIFYNYENSKETFDTFQYMGLNNFDFFSNEIFSNGFEEREEGNI